MSDELGILDGEVGSESAMEALHLARSLPFPLFSSEFLKIRTKSQGIQPLRLNVGQEYLNTIAEQQMQLRGYVRTVLLKARQWGGSTYIQGRFYRNIAQGERGLKAMIVTHRRDATTNIFSMARRFHQLMPQELRPFSGRSNLTQLSFPRRDSSYTVATAGASHIGHSDTIQMLHASEFAMWPNAGDHLKGVFQTVPNQGPGSEIWVESTGAGMANEFFTMVEGARKGESDYQFAFVPWHWFNDPNDAVYYGQPMSDRLAKTLTDEDIRYAEAYGLTEDQMAFRQEKVITDFGGGPQGRLMFCSQFPACPEDAFTTTGEGSFIDPLVVAMARKGRVMVPYGVKMMGIDPSWIGKDRFSVTLRQGRRSRIIGEWKGLRTTRSVGKCIMLINQHQPDVIMIEQCGNASGTVDQLIEYCQRTGIMIIPVNPSEKADRDDLYEDKGEEMHARLLDWLQQDMGVDIDDRDDLQRDLCCQKGEYNRHGRWRPESKQRMRTRLKGQYISPDHKDSLSMTFAYDIPVTAMGQMKQVDPDRPINWRAQT